MISLLGNFIYAFICTIGFAVIFNAPKKSLIKSGIAGGTGWIIYILSNEISQSAIVSTFIASLGIGLIGEFFATYYKNPITVYIIPGIIPLVPGYGLYYTMLSILENDFQKATTYGSDALMVAMSISAALTITLSINAYRKRALQRKKMDKKVDTNK
ncbi:threonine/serine exporter family protein [Alkaliphilus transvaalensis]|uniref:threonine/serine exporter family protein n=1 Tax=Alkaliphilus transvaalensis TaxID=114628 RepID=UPI00047E4A30|nr:threonine/serine exporter family protein [Alkaliphilus transvaalensis]